MSFSVTVSQNIGGQRTRLSTASALIWSTQRTTVPTPPNNNHSGYWRRNLVYVFVLLTIWFIVSFGCGILFVDELDQIRLGGFKLGFWMAQQGSIYVFIILIFVYVFLMNRLDRSFDVDDQEDEGR